MSHIQQCCLVYEVRGSSPGSGYKDSIVRKSSNKRESVNYEHDNKPAVVRKQLGKRQSQHLEQASLLPSVQKPYESEHVTQKDLAEKEAYTPHAHEIVHYLSYARNRVAFHPVSVGTILIDRKRDCNAPGPTLRPMKELRLRCIKATTVRVGNSVRQKQKVESTKEA